MPLPKNKAWFPLKSWGWGWGYPTRWQGWVSLTVFVIALMIGSPLAAKNIALYVLFCLGMSAILGIVVYWKGERISWVWQRGKKCGDDTPTK